MINFDASAGEAEEISELAEAADATEVAPAAAPPRPAPPAMAPPPRFAPPVPAPFAAAAPVAAPAAAAVASIPPAYGQKAYVPVVPPHIAEQVEARDGSRAVEVAAIFEEAVIDVKHFDNPQGGQVTPAPRASSGLARLPSPRCSCSS